MEGGNCSTCGAPLQLSSGGIWYCAKCAWSYIRYVTS